MITFSNHEKAVIVSKIKRYFESELHQEIGGFDAEFLLDFFSTELGCYFYNQALTDVHQLLETQLESFTDTLYQLEKPVPSDKEQR